MSFLEERETIRARMRSNFAQGADEFLLMEALLLISKQLDALTPLEQFAPTKQKKETKDVSKGYKILDQPKLKPFKKEGKWDI